ncbi:transposase, partial [Streptomyces sp. NRRL WC-3618]
MEQALLGRSRGGLTCKVHLASDRRCRPLSIVVTAGQAADSTQFVPVLKKVRVRLPVGRPRTRPAAVAGDKAYS